MLAAIVLSFAIIPFSAIQSTQPGPDSSAKIASISADPYAPLRLYDGKWSVRPTGSKKTDQIENHCARVGEFFACNQFVNGKNTALVIMLPSHQLGNGGYAYRNQALRPDADGSGVWSSLEIAGDRWVYSSDGTDNGKKTYWQTVNVFSGPDKIHFEIQKSEDGKTWTTTMSGDEVRVK